MVSQGTEELVHKHISTMKRLSLLLLSLVASAAISSAQGLSEPWWGVRAGVNFSNIFSPDYSTDYLTGYSVGLSYSYPLLPIIPIYIEGGLYLQKQGARDNGFLTDGGLRSKLTMQKLEVPLLLGFEATISPPWRIQSFVGLYYSVAMSGKFYLGEKEFNPFEKEPLQTLRDAEPAEQQLLHRSDVGIRVGVSLLYAKYLFGFAYDAGILNLYSPSLRDVGYKAQSGCFMLQIGRNF